MKGDAGLGQTCIPRLARIARSKKVGLEKLNQKEKRTCRKSKNIQRDQLSG